MKILLVTESYGWSGGAAQTLLLAKGLLSRQHAVWIACEQGSEIAKRAAGAGIPLLLTRIRGDADLFAAWRLRRWINQLGIQIFHAQHPKAHAVGLLTTFLTGSSCPFAVTRRVSFPVSTNLFSRWKYTSPRIDRYVAVSEGIKQVLVQGGVDTLRVEVIHSGVDPKEFQPSSESQGRALRQSLRLPEGIPTFIKVANFSQWKGQHIFLEAARRYIAAGHAGQFLLVGRGTDEAEITSLVEKLGLIAAVRRLGFRSDIPDLLGLADVSVNSAIEGEGLSGALRESLFLDVPCIASDVSGNRELIEDGVTGKLVPPADPEALCRAMAWMVQNRDEARRLAQQGKAKVMSAFTVDHMVQKTEAMYSALIAR